MSSEANPTTATQPLGASLWLLIGMLLMTGTAELALMAISLLFLPQYFASLKITQWMVARDFAHGVSPLLAALALGLWRQRAALYIAVGFVWMAPFLMIGSYIQAAAGVSDIGITLRQLPFVAMSSGLVAATGCTALLLATPLAPAAFPRRHTAMTALPAGLAASAGLRKHAWLILLIFFMLLPLLALVLRYGELLTISLGAEDFWLSGELQLMMISAGVALPLAFAAALLGLRRRWSSVTLAIVLLWALPIGAFMMRVAGVKNPGAAILLQLSNELSAVGFSFVAASAWTGYLRESPVIHRLYPGRRRRNDLVTDVDVF